MMKCPAAFRLKRWMDRRIAIGGVSGVASTVVLTLVKSLLLDPHLDLPVPQSLPLLECNCPDLPFHFEDIPFWTFLAGIACGALIGPVLDLIWLIRQRWRRFVWAWFCQEAQTARPLHKVIGWVVALAIWNQKTPDCEKNFASFVKIWGGWQCGWTDRVISFQNWTRASASPVQRTRVPSSWWAQLVRQQRPLQNQFRQELPILEERLHLWALTVGITAAKSVERLAGICDVPWTTSIAVSLEETSCVACNQGSTLCCEILRGGPTILHWSLIDSVVWNLSATGTDLGQTQSSLEFRVKVRYQLFWRPRALLGPAGWSNESQCCQRGVGAQPAGAPWSWAGRRGDRA